MASLTLVQGPAGGGKSAVIRDMVQAGEVQVAADVTALWAALGLVQRDPETGRYPVRDEDDPALETALYVQAVAVRQALDAGRDVAVTTSRRGQESRWRAVAESIGAPFRARTVDPGEAEVARRLVEGYGVDVGVTDDAGIDPIESLDDPRLTDECRKAMARWYRSG